MTAFDRHLETASLLDPIDRRRFLQLMGASMALSGLGACTRQPKETIVPYVKQPEQMVPGKPLYYATAALHAGYATGILVESHMGRPTKAEGNPEHPASLGATDLYAQASVLELYDPDRSQVVTNRAQIRPWSTLKTTLAGAVELAKVNRGEGLRVLSGPTTSPTLEAQMAALVVAMPGLRWHRWQPLHRDGARAGARRAFGKIVDTQLRLAEADVILALEADFLCAGAGSVRYAREFSARRRGQAVRAEGRGRPIRLYAIESTPTNTGASADHRIPMRASEIETFARAVAVKLGLAAGGEAQGEHAKLAEIVAEDLQAAKKRALVVAGDDAPAGVHALAHVMNAALGAVGTTVVYTDPVEADPVENLASIRELVEDMEAGKVATLVIFDTNPVYDAPADLDFAKHLEKVGLRVHLGLYADETAELCHWHVPAAHPLESWSDARAFDGTATILQPLIEPLYGGKSAHELLAVMAGKTDATPYDLVREHWNARAAGGDFERFWRRSLHDGVVADTAYPIRSVAIDRDAALAPAKEAAHADGLEIVFRADPTVYDGRYANNAWLQELPKTLTRLTWDNVALLAPATASKLGVTNGDRIEIELLGRRVVAPAWVQPGHPRESVTLPLGYGRRRAGRIGSGIGFDAYALRLAGSSEFARGAKVRNLGDRHPLACAQEHDSMEGRPLVRRASLAHYEEHPEFAKHQAHEPAPGETIHPLPRYEGYAWGMAIDLSACTGCNACVVACQAENNIAVVGKDQVARGREMHWLRIDRYYVGESDAPETYQQPIPCMHCETAPCELVCPVGATAHSDEGLNDMVYNRCVGTRYCANNCPYKVRRFNFYLYSDWTTESFKNVRNPDVTVRSRGVMEKCTYCVQRINLARIDAEKEGRKIRDGEIATACQQVCPSEAIVFGDINDPESRVAKVKADPRNYGLLAELNTRPRTTYLAAVRNPNPKLAGAHEESEPEHHG